MKNKIFTMFFLISMFSTVAENNQILIEKNNLKEREHKTIIFDQPHFDIIDGDCDVKKAYYFNDQYVPRDWNGRESRIKKVGHIRKLSLPGSRIELKPDITVFDPENNSNKTSIVGVIEFVTWRGKEKDSIQLTSRFSAYNKARLQEAFASIENPEIEIEFIVYDYDYDENRYFKRFYTEQALTTIISEDNRVYISDEPDYEIPNPLNFKAQMVFTLNPLKNQKISFAFSASGTVFTREIISNEEEKNENH